MTIKIKRPKRLPGSRERGYYDKCGTSPWWDIIEDELADLVENQDIELTAHPDLVVGSLVARILKENGKDK